MVQEVFIIVNYILTKREGIAQVKEEQNEMIKTQMLVDVCIYVLLMHD